MRLQEEVLHLRGQLERARDEYPALAQDFVTPDEVPKKLSYSPREPHYFPQIHGLDVHFTRFSHAHVAHYRQHWHAHYAGEGKYKLWEPTLPREEPMAVVQIAADLDAEEYQRLDQQDRRAIEKAWLTRIGDYGFRYFRPKRDHDSLFVIAARELELPSAQAARKAVMGLCASVGVDMLRSITRGRFDEAAEIGQGRAGDGLALDLVAQLLRRTIYVFKYDLRRAHSQHGHFLPASCIEGKEPLYITLEAGAYFAQILPRKHRDGVAEEVEGFIVGDGNGPA